MIQVNENLLINNNKLQGDIATGTGKVDVIFKDKKIYFNNLNSYLTRLTIDRYSEKLSEDIELEASYYVGIHGKSDKPLKIYMGDGYKNAKTTGDFIYIEIKGENMKGPIHISSYDGANGYIYALGVYKNLPSEIYMPNKNSVKPENQAIFPIGGGTAKSSLYRGYKGVSLC